jgi:hypothetical protein
MLADFRVGLKPPDGIDEKFMDEQMETIRQMPRIKTNFILEHFVCLVESLTLCKEGLIFGSRNIVKNTAILKQYRRKADSVAK